MKDQFIATASTVIESNIANVWDSLVNPRKIKEYMFGTEVVSDWKEGSPIVWKGNWQGKPYEDKGVILKIVPTKLLQVTHFSPLSGVPELPENYHTLTYKLEEQGLMTSLSLTQDGNNSREEQIHSEGMWNSMLKGLKTFLEK